MTPFQLILLPLLIGILLLAQTSIAKTEQITAESQLRAILAIEPDNDKVRERLAVLLLNTKRPAAAAYHTGFLSRKAKDKALRNDAARLYERLEGPAWGWRPILSFSPSSNLNKGSTKNSVSLGDTEFSIDPDSRAKNGMGLTFGASVWRKWRPSEVWYARWQTEATATIYDHDDMEARQGIRTSLAYSRRLYNGSLELGGTLDVSFAEGRLQRRLVGPSMTRIWKLSETRKSSVQFEFRDAHYPNKTFRSGYRIDLTPGWVEEISPSFRVSFGLPLAFGRTERDHLDFNGYGANLTLAKRWKDTPWQTSIGIGFKRDRYRGDFPGAAAPREDNVTTISIGQSNQNWSIKGFVPQLRYVYTRSESNVSLYDFDSHDVQVTFQKQF